MFPKRGAASPTKNPKKEMLGNHHCSDTTEFFVIMYYPGHDPGRKYEIKSDTDLVKNWDVLEKGTSVIVKFGHASLEGIVLYITENLTDAQLNFNKVVKEHQRDFGSAMEEQFEAMDESMDSPTVESVDRETQTDIDTFTVIHRTAIYAAYRMLRIQHDELRSKYDRAISKLTPNRALDLEFGTAMPNVDVENDSSMYSHSSMESYEIHEFMVSPLNNIDENYDRGNDSIQIGLAGTRIPMRTFESINWENFSTATRKVLDVLFPQVVLATHFPNAKQKRLDPVIVSDVVELISSKCKIPSSYVENAIMTKCIEESLAYNRDFQYRQERSDEYYFEEN